MSILKQIEVKPQQQISNAGGDVWHALKSAEDSFIGFGEAYFSWVDPGSIKAWKKHLDMTINLIVPIGMVRFMGYELENDSFREERIGSCFYTTESRYLRESGLVFKEFLKHRV